MRTVTGTVLLIVATLIGLVGAFAFLETGLDWSFSKPSSVLEDSPQWDAEREFSVGFGVSALVVWLVLAVTAFFALLLGRERRRPAIASILVGLSAAVVLGAVIAVLSVSPVGEQYPLPPWNRA